MYPEVHCEGWRETQGSEIHVSFSHASAPPVGPLPPGDDAQSCRNCPLERAWPRPVSWSSVRTSPRRLTGQHLPPTLVLGLAGHPGVGGLGQEVKVYTSPFSSALDPEGFSWGEGQGSAVFSLLNLALPHRENKRTVSILFVKRAFSYSKLLAWKNWEATVSPDRSEVCVGAAQMGLGCCIY